MAQQVIMLIWKSCGVICKRPRGEGSGFIRTIFTAPVLGVKGHFPGFFELAGPPQPLSSITKIRSCPGLFFSGAAEQ
jgi:hypothetical protein